MYLTCWKFHCKTRNTDRENGTRDQKKIAQGLAVTVKCMLTCNRPYKIPISSCIGDKLLFQTSKGITIEINNLNISIIINNDCNVNETQLIRQSLDNKNHIKITARQYTMKLLDFLFFKSHLTVWPLILTVPNMTHSVQTLRGKGGNLKSTPPMVNWWLQLIQSRESKEQTWNSCLETSYSIWFAGGVVIICQSLPLYYFTLQNKASTGYLRVGKHSSNSKILPAHD